MLNSFITRVLKEAPQKLILLVIFCFAVDVSHSQQAASNFAQAASGNLSKQQVDMLVKRFAGRPHKSFVDFCLSIYNSSRLTLSPSQRDAIGKFSLRQELTGGEREVIFRVLGIYAQLKYGGEALRLLGDLVEIPTVHDPAIAQHRNKNFLLAGKLLQAKSVEFGLKFRNVDNRVFEVGFPWPDLKGKSVALHAHIDVVPAEPNNWQLPNGQMLDPFKLTRVANKLYGRGTQDDKNAIVATMYAMRVIVEERIRLFNDMRLLIDTTEETTGEAMPYYLKRNPTPAYNIALDGDYPVVIAEKGYGIVKAKFPIESNKGNNTERVLSVTGGLAYNQIPAVSNAEIVSLNALALAEKINQLSQSFVQKYGDNFRLQATAEDKIVRLQLTGVSAHSSKPESGINPVSRMMIFINQLSKEQLVAPNHITKAAAYAAENWGIGYLGKTIGIEYRHDFMGSLTSSITKLSDDGSVFEIAVNLRVPVGQPLSALESKIEDKLKSWSVSRDVQFELSISIKEPMYRNPKALWLNALSTIASESLLLPNKFGSSANGTSINNLPNGVQFGLSMPNEKYTGHNSLEFKTLDQFLLDLQIVTEMIVRVGQMRKLD